MPQKIWIPQSTDLCAISDVRSRLNLDLVSSPIFQVVVADPGKEYASAPTAMVVPGTGVGSGLVLGDVTLDGDGVATVAIVEPGSYQIAPTIVVEGGGGVGANVLAYFQSDNLLQQLISTSSYQMLSNMYRPAGVLSQLVAERRNGSGTAQMALSVWPVQSVQSFYIGSTAVPQSPDGFQYGWVCDGNSIALVGGGGLLLGPYSFAGAAIPFAAGVIPAGMQNCTVNYTAGFTAIPGDVEDAAIELAATKFKRRQHLDLKSESIAVSGQTTSYNTAAFSDNVKSVINRYKLLTSWPAGINPAAAIVWGNQPGTWGGA